MIQLKKIFALLTSRERKNAFLLFVMILIMAIFDVAGVASIMPFIAVLANPQVVQTNELLLSLYNFFNFSNIQEFLFFLGFFAFLLLLFSLAFKSLTIYAQVRFSRMREYTIGKRLIEGYLGHNYSWFLNRHSGELAKTILSEISAVVGGAILPLMTLIAQSVVSFTLFILLIIVDTKLTIIVIGVLGFSYLLIYKLLSNYLAKIGRERVEANEERFKVVSEAFGAIKEVKILSLESEYVRRFSKPAEIFAKHQSSALVIAQLPRFLLEAIAFGGMMLVILYLIKNNSGLSSALPIIALYAFAGYRLIPALQQIYRSATQLRFSNAAINALHKDFVSLKPLSKDPFQDVEPINFKNEIKVNSITYSYPDSPLNALERVSLSIPVHSVIGIVGATGSGKTTLFDFMLGLLNSKDGELSVDGVQIHSKNLQSWQKSIGYIPQQIYLSDDTIAANIAFGIPADNIDYESVERAAKIANLHDFVVNDLPNGYDTKVGERGVRLSGGQRQRIGIARALFNKPQILMMDEATSALDNITEKAVMEAISKLSEETTIIIIAHRLSTVKKCDKIFIMESGKIDAEGTYKELSNTNKIFKKMILN